MKWKTSFKKGKEIILATSSADNKPNANIVISLGFVEGRLLVADCQMKNTIKNLKVNDNICVVGGYLRMTGKAKIYPEGKYFDICVKNNKGYEVKNAILITPKRLFDLGRVMPIKLK